jgi:hypothetical protein
MRPAVLGLAGVLAATAFWAWPAWAQAPELPDCDPASAPALHFVGLPSHIPFGRPQRFGFEDSLRTDSIAVGEITVEMVSHDGEVFFEGKIRGRGAALLWIQLDLEDPPARVYASFVEEAPDLTRCIREISKRVRGRRLGKRFRGYVEGAGGFGPDRHYIIGNGLQYTFIDRWASRTRYRVCWRSEVNGRQSCRRRRTGPAGRPSRTPYLAAPEVVGWWVARWSVRRRVVTRWRFYVGLGD